MTYHSSSKHCLPARYDKWTSFDFARATGRVTWAYGSSGELRIILIVPSSAGSAQSRLTAYVLEYARLYFWWLVHGTLLCFVTGRSIHACLESGPQRHRESSRRCRQHGLDGWSNATREVCSAAYIMGGKFTRVISADDVRNPRRRKNVAFRPSLKLFSTCTAFFQPVHRALTRTREVSVRPTAELCFIAIVSTAQLQAIHYQTLGANAKPAVR